MTEYPHRESVVDRPDSTRSWFGRLLKGIAVGVGAILPGLSGGVLAVIFGLYDPMIRFLANVRHHFVRNVLFFVPIAIGMGLGILAFSVVVEAAFASYAAQFTCLFIGFVIGTFPSLYRQAGRNGRSTTHLVIMGVAVAAVFLLMLAGGQVLVQVEPSIPVWFGSGALVGLGVIVPGMSPSNFLIYFGLYDKMASSITDFDMSVIIPLFLGMVACVMLLAKGAAWMFDRYFTGMYHFILGMVIGSSLAILPTVVFPAFTPDGLESSGLTLTFAVGFAVVMLVAGTIASYLFSKVEDTVSDVRHEIEETAAEIVDD